MAKRTDLRPVVTLRSTAGTGYSYVTRKNRRTTRTAWSCASSTPSPASTSTSARPADLTEAGGRGSQDTDPAPDAAVGPLVVPAYARQRASVRACWSAGALGGDVLTGVVVGAVSDVPRDDSRGERREGRDDVDAVAKEFDESLLGVVDAGTRDAVDGQRDDLGRVRRTHCRSIEAHACQMDACPALRRRRGREGGPGRL